MKRLALFCILVLGCDLSDQDMVAEHRPGTAPAFEVAPGESLDLLESRPLRTNPDTSTRSTPDACAGYGPDPGFVLAPERILWADLCIGNIANVEACFVSDYEEDNGVELPGPAIEVWCEFDCGGEGIDLSRAVLDYPDFDEVAVRYTLPNPCPLEVAG